MQYRATVLINHWLPSKAECLHKETWTMLATFLSCFTEFKNILVIVEMVDYVMENRQQRCTIVRRTSCRRRVHCNHDAINEFNWKLMLAVARLGKI